MAKQHWQANFLIPRMFGVICRFWRVHANNLQSLKLIVKFSYSNQVYIALALSFGLSFIGLCAAAFPYLRTFPAIDAKLPARPHWKVMNKIRVGVLFGGRSGEHEVSLL